MAKRIDVLDKEELNFILSNLKEDTIPAWGRLRAQNMIEHLVEAVEYTNGKKFTELDVTPELATKGKAKCVNEHFEIPKNVLGFLSDRMTCKRFNNLEAAIKHLNEELDAFHLYFAIPNRTATHAAFGPMNYQEWLLWHGKHFAHHFYQFGLI